MDKQQNKAADEKQVRLQRQLENIRIAVGPEKEQALLDTLNRLRNSVLASAETIAFEHPDQFDRYVDGIHALSSGLEGSIIAANGRPIDKTITRVREAAVNIGFGKFVTRAGKQERPQD